MKYRRFRAWQENPFRYAMNEEESHRCCNCDREYVGNFCSHGDIPKLTLGQSPCEPEILYSRNCKKMD